MDDANKMKALLIALAHWQESLENETREIKAEQEVVRETIEEEKEDQRNDSTGIFGDDDGW